MHKKVIWHIRTESFCQSGKEIQVISGTGFFTQLGEVRTICLLKNKSARLQDYSSICQHSTILCVISIWPKTTIITDR